MFASVTAHIAALYAAFLGVGIAIGVSPMIMALTLAFSSNIMMSFTQYATGQAPVYFGTNYVPMKDWWRVGFCVSVVNIIIWFGIGGIYWHLIGLF